MASAVLPALSSHQVATSPPTTITMMEQKSSLLLLLPPLLLPPLPINANVRKLLPSVTSLLLLYPNEEE